jgi:hypothetical protein
MLNFEVILMRLNAGFSRATLILGYKNVSDYKRTRRKCEIHRPIKHCFTVGQEIT